MIRSYEDLEVYKRSYAAAKVVYDMSKILPKEEMYGLTSQMRRAALSIALNIAEGYGKKSSEAEFKRFLAMGAGSCNEMRVLLDFCRDMKLIETEACERVKAEYEEIGKMLSGLINKWQNKD